MGDGWSDGKVTESRDRGGNGERRRGFMMKGKTKKSEKLNERHKVEKDNVSSSQYLPPLP